MPLTLHEAIIPARLQTLSATRALVDKAEEWCQAEGKPQTVILGATLTDGMWSFDWQIRSVWMHAAHSLAAVQSGMFEPNFSDIPDSFDACRKQLDTARDVCRVMEPDELENLADNNLDFVMGGTVRMQFTVQNFLLSFSNPNFFFHAATVYDILRMKGLEIGKRDFLGAVQVKS